MKGSSHAAPLRPRKLLVAIDAEGLSDHGVCAAFEIARRFDAHVDLVHAVRRSALPWKSGEDPRVVVSDEDLFAATRKSLAARLEKVLQRETLGVRVGELLDVLPGPPAKVILERARETSADLIVLGALRRRPILDFGSTARAVLAKAPCAIWAQPGPFTEIRTILVPVDFSAESSCAIATGCLFARQLGARVQVLHCFELPILVGSWEGPTLAVLTEDLRRSSSTLLERALEQVDWDGVEHTSTVAEGPAAERVLEHAQAADLVVMGTHGRTGFAAALLGSVAYSVLKHTTKPVLAVRKIDRDFVA